ncbi:MAG: adenylate/guanylate cyclase domain-containing protein [Phormidesmis sp.]
MNTSVHPQIQRTLAAVVVTDAVSFSKCMSQDEDRALAMINRDLQLISELCDFFEGQILKTVGDGVLMYFISAVQAAACAVEMQKTFANFTHNGHGSEHFTHRVGVHLGDIFFNQQDMMGTGVNIAARLEAAAKPGAICMSQVVYDVVKSRLELDAVYAGELPLKNIEEAIAAYHVWPLGMKPQEPPSSSTEDTEAVAPLTITPVNAALKALSEHPNSRRIKKLLYGTHQTAWENDFAKIEGVSLRLLLESLTERNDSLEDCRHSLYQIVSTLNRQEEYSQVAEVVLENLHDLYALSGKESAPIESMGGTFSGQENEPEESGFLVKSPIDALHQDIADLLEQTPERVRMKKMLYCLCYDSWENDSDRILAMSTVALVSELYRQITTVQGLQNRLRTVLMRLNRKSKYAPIANQIFAECQILYPEDDSQITMPGEVSVEDSAGDNTQIKISKKPSSRWMTPNKSAGQSADTVAEAASNNSTLLRSLG